MNISDLLTLASEEPVATADQNIMIEYIDKFLKVMITSAYIYYNNYS